MSKINHLTPAQEALIPIYREKWRAIALSTERIHRQKAIKAVEAAYTALNLKEPKILFSESPDNALGIVLKTQNFTPTLLYSRLISLLFEKSETRIENQLELKLQIFLAKELASPFHQLLGGYWVESQLLQKYDQSYQKLGHQQKKVLSNCYGAAVPFCCMDDFCISVLDIIFERKPFQALQSLLTFCGTLLTYCSDKQNICIVCDRPTKLSFDPEGLLHGENGEPAILFADGFAVYADHGRLIHP